jgi:hypothetical protein
MAHSDPKDATPGGAVRPVAGELVKGVGKDFPLIEGYSQQDLTLRAGANLLAGIRFIGDMMQAPEQNLEYAFEAKLDLQGLYPSIRVSERGTFNVNPSPR